MIGLMTPFRVNNYGTKLQAYAVQESIRSLGVETQIIDYISPGEKTTPKNFLRKCFYKLIREMYSDRRNVQQVGSELKKRQQERAEAINEFDRTHLRLSEPIRSYEQLQGLGKRYDAVVTGSDQIFNPVNVSGRMYLLEWVDGAVKKIAYSPSFGVEQVPAVLKGKYRRELKRFDALSVREESGRRIMQQLGFVQTERTLDPTLVLEKEKWEDLAQQSAQSSAQGHIMCYFLGGLPLGREIAKQAAQEADCKIVLLPHFKGYSPEDEALEAEKKYAVSVADFVALIRGARLVVTDSFHATVFSIIFHRPFIAVARHEESRYSTNSRLRTFLEMLGLEDRMCASAEEALERMKKDIDYRQADAVLMRERIKTREYLRKSLMGD